jgi:RND superfamily putative drug exporter
MIEARNGSGAPVTGVSIGIASRILRARAAALLVVLAWSGAALAGVLALPRLASLSVTDPAAFFPDSAPNLEARHAIDRLFPGAVPQSQIVLVLESEGPIEAHAGVVAELTARLRALGSAHVASVLSPSDDPLLAQRLLSPHAALIVIRLGVGYASEESIPLVGEVEGIASAAAGGRGLRVSVSGDATLGRDYNVAIEEGALHATLATLGLVGLILLWVYGSPVVATVSILTLAAALAVTFGLVVGAASLGLPVAYQIRPFLVAIVYGVGTDYNLLLFSRVREEQAAGNAERMKLAWRASLPVLLASGAAVSVGTASMAFADFGLFRYCGPALAIGVATTVAATLTLAPALMQLLGRHLFWPRRSGLAAAPSRVWPLVARLVLDRPAFVLIVPTLALAPLALFGARAVPLLVVEIDVPEGSPSSAGYAAVKQHFDLSMVAPLTLALSFPEGETRADGGFRSTGGLHALDRLAARLAEQPGIERVASATRPGGETDLLARAKLASQLAELAAGLAGARAGAGALESGLASARREIAGGRDELSAREQAVAEEQRQSLLGAFAPGRFEDARRDLAGLRSDLGELDAGLASAQQGAGRLQRGLAQAVERLRALLAAPGADRVLDGVTLTPGDVAANPDLGRALDWYVTREGHASRLEVELTSAPSSPESVRVLRDLRVSLPVMIESLGLGRLRIWLGGLTAITDDLERLTRSDLRRVGLLVTVGTFLLLLALLRRVASSAAVTVWLLASYLTALGALELGVRAGIWAGIDWKTPFFLFVLLVAIGADYGVFLLGRLQEEERRAPFAPALARTLAATGPVVTSCGLVLAGTFAALLLARIAFLEQVGAGVTVGVLVDTLIVRPFLLPASAILLRRADRH